MTVASITAAIGFCFPNRVVHNGIIENFVEPREELKRDGVVLESDTDTEVFVQFLGR